MSYYLLNSFQSVKKNCYPPQMHIIIIICASLIVHICSGLFTYAVECSHMQLIVHICSWLFTYTVDYSYEVDCSHMQWIVHKMVSSLRITNQAQNSRRNHIMSRVLKSVNRPTMHHCCGYYLHFGEYFCALLKLEQISKNIVKQKTLLF